jgi:Uma2 family endonuclease
VNLPLPAAPLSYAEYLALEAQSETKHEYLHGEIFAMAGGTIEHGRLQVEIIVQLRLGLENRSCRVFSSDVRIRVEETDLATYPDGTVVCGELQVSPKDKNAIANPLLLVEVLSDSTEAYDRGQKFAHYRRIPSLREYLLVSQQRPHLELYRKTESGRWELLEATAGESLELALGVRLDVDAIYRDALKAVT